MALQMHADGDPQHNVVEAVLARWNLKSADLAQFFQTAVAAQLAATPFHPPGSGGLLRYIHLVGAARRTARERGMYPLNDDGLAYIVHPETGDRLGFVAAEDGLHTGTLRSKPRGGAGRYAVSANLLTLFDADAEFSNPVDVPSGRTWNVIYQADVANRTVLAELVVPTHIDDTARICGYACRVLVPLIDLNSPIESDSDDDAFGFDVEQI